LQIISKAPEPLYLTSRRRRGRGIKTTEDKSEKQQCSKEEGGAAASRKRKRDEGNDNLTPYPTTKMFAGGPLYELQRFLGKHQLHSFYGGFAAKNITTIKALKKLSKEEIMKICAEMKMPKVAMERLLEELGHKKKKAPVTVPAKLQPTVPKHNKKPVKNNKAPAIGKTGETSSMEAKIEEKKENGYLSKTQASTYYHFKSTDKSQAAKYDAKKVEDESKAQFKAAKGASAWNPGNTFEDRDFTTFANARWKEMMKGFKFEGFGNVRVSRMSATNMDYSIIINRGRIKYIYDMAFTCEWKCEIEGTKVEGTLKVSEIAPDEDEDDWEYDVIVTKGGAVAGAIPKDVIMNNKPVIWGMIRELLAELKAKGPA